LDAVRAESVEEVAQQRMASLFLAALELLTQTFLLTATRTLSCRVHATLQFGYGHANKPSIGICQLGA
jgi:hypothetical protein